VNLGFAAEKDAGTFLDRVPALTRLCEETARLPGLRVRVLGRFSRDEDVHRNGIDYRFRADDPGALLAGPRHVPWRLLRLARGLRPDVVHLHGLLFPVQAAALRLALGRGPVLVVQHHGERPEGRMRPACARALFHAADGFLFTSAGIAEEWTRTGVLAPAWPLLEVVEASTDFAPLPRDEARRRAPLPGAPAVLWVGRLHEKKDPLTAVAGFARAVEQLPGAQLSMAFREAPLLPEVRAFVASSPALAGRVHLLGEVPHADLPAYFAAVDLFLTSSPAEAANFALLEALACGTPPVASDIPAHRAVTGAGAVGTLFPARDVAGCARALVEAAARLSAESRAEARRHFEERLSWPAVARQALAAYDALAARRRSPRPRG